MRIVLVRCSLKAHYGLVSHCTKLSVEDGGKKKPLTAHDSSFLHTMSVTGHTKGKTLTAVLSNLLFRDVRFKIVNKTKLQTEHKK